MNTTTTTFIPQVQAKVAIAIDKVTSWTEKYYVNDDVVLNHVVTREELEAAGAEFDGEDIVGTLPCSRMTYRVAPNGAVTATIGDVTKVWFSIENGGGYETSEGNQPKKIRHMVTAIGMLKRIASLF